MFVPEKIEGPVKKYAIYLQPCKHRRACCRRTMRCACPKRPKGRLAGTHTSCVPAYTAGPPFGEACDARARKDRRGAIDLRPRKHHRACCQGNMQCACPKRPMGRFAETQSICSGGCRGSMRCACRKIPKGH